MKIQKMQVIRSLWLMILILVSSLAQGQAASADESGWLGLSVGVGGEVAAVNVSMGDRVQKGQALLSLDTQLYQAELVAAKAAMAAEKFALLLAEDDYERQQELYDEGSLSTVELQILELGVLQAKSKAAASRHAVRQAEQNLAYAHIYAPVDGEVMTLPTVGKRVSAVAGLPVLIKLRPE